ncbi:MAG: SH3 domain-containing protein, partial [Clostridia bacterium]|nr:SH3 domain-containing protein [Clostridia bacterium]
MLKNNILQKKKKFISIVMLIILIIYICASQLLQIKSYAAQTTESYSSSKISKYPGYKALIDNLKSKYPNWKFKILYTGLDWNQVIKNETSASHGRNIVDSSKTGSWICNTCGDKLYDTGRWKCASEVSVSYYMDPRNWLNEDYIFQFENLSYDSNTQKIEGVNKIISDAPWMQGSSITYTKTDGTTATINKSYAQIIMEASKQANMSPYHLASRIRQEQGTGKTASSTAKGTYEGYEGYYNYCNIGASGSSESAIIVNALNYAKNKKWTDPETAIKGAALYIAQSYISVGQSTVYLQKFDVDNSDGKLYYHQYMQNVSAAVSESLTVKKSYSDMKMLNNSFTFLIPVYENMPEEVSASPDSSTIVTQSVKVTGNDIQVRNSPSLLGTVLIKLKKDDVVLRIECAASEVGGYYWDKIVLPSGAKGYIARNYLTQIKDVTNTNISAVANTSVNLRNGPGTSGTAIVTTLISGQSVTIIEKGVYNNLNEHNWVRVKLSNGTQGYIAEQYLTEVGNNGNNNNENNN